MGASSRGMSASQQYNAMELTELGATWTISATVPSEITAHPYSRHSWPRAAVSFAFSDAPGRPRKWSCTANTPHLGCARFTSTLAGSSASARGEYWP